MTDKPLANGAEHDLTPMAPVQPARFTAARKRSIGSHAVARLRERLTRVDDLARSERELGDLLDLVVDQSLCAGNGMVVLDEGRDTTLVPLSPRIPDTWAIVRPNYYRTGPPQAVITVLTTAMVNSNLAHEGTWTATTPQDQEAGRDRAEAENVKVTTSLGEKLSGVRIDELKPKPDPKARDNVAVVAEWVVCIPDGAQLRYEQVDQVHLTERVNELLGQAVTPRVFKEVALRVQVDSDSLGMAT